MPSKRSKLNSCHLLGKNWNLNISYISIRIYIEWEREETYLTASNDVEMLGQDIHELAFPFVAPLRPQNTGDLTQRSDSTQSFTRPLHRGWRRRRCDGLDGACRDLAVVEEEVVPTATAISAYFAQAPVWGRDGVGIESQRWEVHGGVDLPLALKRERERQHGKAAEGFERERNEVPPVAAVTEFIWSLDPLKWGHDEMSHFRTTDHFTMSPDNRIRSFTQVVIGGVHPLVYGPIIQKIYYFK